jgi:type II secretory pathway component PulF
MRQLATLLKAGLTLEEVLSVLVEQSDASAQIVASSARFGHG